MCVYPPTPSHVLRTGSEKYRVDEELCEANDPCEARLVKSIEGLNDPCEAWLV